ncbi:hypothetical protein [Streptococcus sp. DD13]|uniref:hypothetical protein n=1 Tax=Streptococcus sp. DD13 TaxID=1777881 RepID=UPI000793A732|nr:hypothetical protein [Streptococcus sp. DD13]KXT79105.1 hypothetical protein STRDD13_00224 [Streptococcus sp. DD13]
MTDKKRKGYSTSEGQREADKRWASKNKEHKNYLSRRSNARGFIRSLATTEDLHELQDLINERLK